MGTKLIEKGFKAEDEIERKRILIARTVGLIVKKLKQSEIIEKFKFKNDNIIFEMDFNSCSKIEFRANKKIPKGIEVRFYFSIFHINGVNEISNKDISLVYKKLREITEGVDKKFCHHLITSIEDYLKETIEQAQ